MCCHACGTAPDGIIKAEFANKLGIFTHPSHSTLAFLTANRYTILSSEEMASGKNPELPDYDIGGITMKTLNAIVKVLAVWMVEWTLLSIVDIAVHFFADFTSPSSRVD